MGTVNDLDRILDTSYMSKWRYIPYNAQDNTHHRTTVPADCVGSDESEAVERSVCKYLDEIFLRPMTMDTSCCKHFFRNYSNNISAEDTLVPPLWEKRGHNVLLSFVLFTRLYAAEPVPSR